MAEAPIVDVDTLRDQVLDKYRAVAAVFEPHAPAARRVMSRRP